MNTTIPDNWYETFFAGINCEMWEIAGTQQMTNDEVAFLLSVFHLPKGSKILDLPCGTGRHSVELATQGYNLTAIDISKEFINSLKKKVAEQQLNIKIIHANILSLELQDSFDGAFCIGNSFGYFPYADMQIFIQKVSNLLKPKAKWIINSGLMAESFLAKFIKEKTYELPGMTMHINNDYDEWNSCLLTTLTYIKNGKEEAHQFKHHVYTIAETIRMLKNCGFSTTAIYNSTNKELYKMGDAQIYLVAEKI